MLRIHIGSIPRKGMHVEEKIDATTLPLLRAFSRGGDDVRFNQSLHVIIHATLAGETVLIDGGVKSVVRMTCSRCLISFDMSVESDFSATAVPEWSAPSPSAAEDEIELTANDMDLIAYDGDSIDLREEVAQQLIMALPFTPLCQKTCKGLCSQCGADLNRTRCRCASENSTSPFGVLKTLSFPEEQE